jgi:hypothetical protein
MQSDEHSHHSTAGKIEPSATFATCAMGGMYTKSVRRSRNGWIARRWSVGPLLPRFLQGREEERLTKSTVLFLSGGFSAMRHYKIYIQLENIASQFILFPYRHQQWRTDEAQVRPGNLVDKEEWEANYYDPNSQLNKSVWDRHVWSPPEVQAAAQLLFRHLAKSMKGRR